MWQTGLSIEDRGFLYAEACFETFRVIRGEIFNWQEHVSRLGKGLACFGIDVPEGLYEDCLKVAAGQGPDTLVRVTVTGGGGKWGLDPPDQRRCGVYFCVRPFTSPGKEISLQSAQWPFPIRSRLAKFTADYAESLKAMRLIRGQLNHHDPLICDDMHVCSGLTANVLVYREQRWWTPVGKGVLPGVIRGALLQSNAVCESVCPLSWLEDCEAMALCNSGFFILPVYQINGRVLSGPGSAFEVLYRSLAGRPGVPCQE